MTKEVRFSVPLLSLIDCQTTPKLGDQGHMLLFCFFNFIKISNIKLNMYPFTIKGSLDLNKRFR